MKSAFAAVLLVTLAIVSSDSQGVYPKPVIASRALSTPSCFSPPNYLRSYTWESASNGEGIELFDVALAHPQAADRYRQSLSQPRPQNQKNCLRARLDYRTNLLHHMGSFDVVSDTYNCTRPANQGWTFDCVARRFPGFSFRFYAIKSDNLSWILSYECVSSTVVSATWTLWVSPGKTISQSTKAGILSTVRALGFNPNEYVEFAPDCVYSNKAFKKRTCDCCTEERARYI